MKKIYKIFLLLILLISISQCQKKSDKIIAEVNGEKLYETEFRTLFTKSEWQNTSQEEKNEIIKNWVEITLLAKEAEKRGLGANPEVKSNIKYSRKTILANKILTNELNKIDATESEIFKYYNLNRHLYMKKITSYKIQKFVVANWAIADSAIKLFNKNEVFYTVAKNLGRNYVVKTVEKNDVSSALWTQLSRMKRWNIRIVNDNNKLIIVQLLDVKSEEKPLAFQAIKDSLRIVLMSKKREQFLENTLDSLKIKYKAKYQIQGEK